MTHFTVDADDWLQGVEKIPTPHRGDTIAPNLILHHWTAGGSGRQSVEVLHRLGLSAHLVVERDGTVYQTAPFTRRCAHAGRSRWRGRAGVNGFSIGIEWANYGPLLRDGDGYLTVYGGRYDGPPPLEGPHANGSRQYLFWEPFTQAQGEVGLALQAALFDRYPSLTGIAGHHEVSPGRKIDISPDPWLDRWRRAAAERIAARASDSDKPATPDEPGRRRAAPMEAEPVNFAAVQQALNLAGQTPRLAVDGRPGPHTDAAIRAFQASAGLVVDGIAGPKTRTALGL